MPQTAQRYSRRPTDADNGPALLSAAQRCPQRPTDAAHRCRQRPTDSNNAKSPGPWVRGSIRSRERTRTTNRWNIVEGNGLVISDESYAALLESAVWLIDINRLIDTLERVGRRVRPFRRNYPIWVNSTLAIGKAWSNFYSPEEVCPQSAMDSLDSLAEVLDMLTPAPGNQTHEQLMDLANQISEGIENDPTLTDQLRIHLQRVVNHLRNCLANPGAYNLADFAEAADDAVTAVKAAAGESTDKTWKERWSKISTLVAYPTIAGLLTNGVSTAAGEIASHILKAIGQA
ncbi:MULTISPECIES: hypothetical protein [Actinomyces]|uniref:Uncharacterized protein n=1 Tax=Actinomyces marmotae TaxID=2737173 RepID=A0A6M8B9F9_9ACTO|nr:MULTISPECIES: hypothetical protein [Actinomyces]QKD79843.1 hypothetical protein HPC72_05930 [Actinomyces marmotae]